MNSKHSIVLRYLLPRLQDVLFIAIFGVVIGFGPRLFNIDGDLGRHLTIGEHILENKDIPTRDLFSHTKLGDRLVPHEWLAQVVFALAHRVDHLDAVVWLSALVIAYTFVLLYKQVLQRNGMILVSLGLTILAAAASSLHWLARPHIWTMLFVVLWIGELERIKAGSYSGWWRVPLIMLLWANMHGAFIAGFVIWGAYMVGAMWEGEDFWGDRVKWLSVIGGISVLVTILNPSSWFLWETSLGYLQNRYLVSHTAEYLPPNFHDPSTWPFMGMIVLSLVFLGQRRDRIPLTGLLLLVGWTVMAMYSVRNVPLYCLVVTPILGEVIFVAPSHNKNKDSLQNRLLQVDRSLYGGFLPTVVLIGVAIAYMNGVNLDFQGRGNIFLPEVFPIKATNFIESSDPPGRMFNYFPWGGYLLYRLWPTEKVFIDGQTDFYGESLTREYEQVITMSEGWEDVLEKHGVTWVLMPTDSLFVRQMRSSHDWRVIFADRTATLLVRHIVQYKCYQ